MNLLSGITNESIKSLKKHNVIQNPAESVPEQTKPKLWDEARKPQHSLMVYKQLMIVPCWGDMG